MQARRGNMFTPPPESRTLKEFFDSKFTNSSIKKNLFNQDKVHSSLQQNFPIHEFSGEIAIHSAREPKRLENITYSKIMATHRHKRINLKMEKEDARDRLTQTNDYSGDKLTLFFNKSKQEAEDSYFKK